jgi:hypothetical protein
MAFFGYSVRELAKEGRERRKEPNMNVDQMVFLARHLPPAEKLRLIELIAHELSERHAVGETGPTQSLLGLCADLGPPPSGEDIDEVRREMWSGFPRDDIR